MGQVTDKVHTLQHKGLTQELLRITLFSRTMADLKLKNQTTSFATKHQHRQCIYDALLLLLKYLARIFRRFLFSLRILFFLHYKVCTLYKVSKLGSTLQVWVSYKIHSCENYSNIQGYISNLVENWHTYSYWQGDIKTKISDLGVNWCPKYGLQNFKKKKRKWCRPTTVKLQYLWFCGT